MIGVGVVGYGYWGPNLVRNFAEAAEAQLIAVCDLRPERLDTLRKRYPSVALTTHYEDLLGNPHIQAIAVATPVSSHFDLTRRALAAGKHVLVEKPLATTSEQCLQLIETAHQRNLVLQVDHTFVYTGAVRKMRDLVTTKELGEILYYDSVRVNLGLFQHDVNVVWDLAVHDLSIMDYVLGIQPVAVSATGMSHVNGNPANMAYVTLFFEGRMIAHLHVNWLSPVKVRRTLVGGSRKMIVYDDLEPSEKIKLYDKGITVNGLAEEDIHQQLVSYRSGDLWVPQLDGTEALRTEIAHFCQCIQKGQNPLTDGQSGLRIVRLLEAATQSLNKRGLLIELRSL